MVGMGGLSASERGEKPDSATPYWFATHALHFEHPLVVLLVGESQVTHRIRNYLLVFSKDDVPWGFFLAAVLLRSAFLRLSAF